MKKLTAIKIGLMSLPVIIAIKFSGGSWLWGFVILVASSFAIDLLLRAGFFAYFLAKQYRKERAL